MEHQTHQETQEQNVAVIISDTEAGNGELVALSPMDMPVEVFTGALNRREANRRALLKWIQTSLVQGVDYGSIHIAGKQKCRYAQEGRAWDCTVKSHWSKNSLFKPGAEKILGMMSLTARYPNIHIYEEAAINGQEIKTIILKCELRTSNGMVVGEGMGARTVSQDYGDINKTIKMASKSAMIDATLRVAGLSQIFTQDIEDMFRDKENGKEAGEAQTVSPQPQTEKPQNPAVRTNGDRRITAVLYRQILCLGKEKGMTQQEIKKWCIDTYGTATDHLRVSQASHFIEELKSV